MSIHTINTNSLGITEYTGLSLISVVEHGGQMYAITTTELLEFTGTDDDGTDIDIIFKTGLLNFNDESLKQMDSVYLSGTSSENLTLTTTTIEDGIATNRAYTVDSWTGLKYERRKLLGRGVKSKWWQVKIANTNGGSFILRNLKALVAPASRRIQ